MENESVNMNRNNGVENWNPYGWHLESRGLESGNQYFCGFCSWGEFNFGEERHLATSYKALEVEKYASALNPKAENLNKAKKKHGRNETMFQKFADSDSLQVYLVKKINNNKK